MNAPTETTAPDLPTELPSPGARLRLARERAGLGVDDLAAQLKLARTTLEAMERDDFASLSEPVYVRGYYRKIAKALDIPDRELLDAYEAHHPVQAAPMKTQPLPLAGGIDDGPSPKAQSQGLLLVAVVVALSVVLLAWLAEPSPTVRVSTPSVSPPAPVEPASAEDGQAAESAEATADTTLPAAESQPSPGDAPGSSQVSSTGVEPAARPTPTPEPVAVAERSPPPAAAPGQLALQFSEASFVRIEDAGGRTLLIGLVRGGQERVLDGQPPYSVFLGNAPVVKVFHGGKSVEFADKVNPQNNTARFSVP